MNVLRWTGLLVVLTIALTLVGCKNDEDVATTDDSLAVPPVAVPVVSGLQEPVSLQFLGKTVLLAAERRTGAIRWIEKGMLRPEPFVSISAGGQLLDLAVDPNYPGHPYVYVLQAGSGGSSAQVVRFTVKDGKGSDPQTVITGLPAGGRLLFGTDGMLFVTVGDSGKSDQAQNYDVLSGKVLRFTPEGKVPADNPLEKAQTGTASNPENDAKQFEGDKTPVYTLGHRAPFGITRNPDSGEIYITDTGPDRDDVIEHLVAAENYGWPVVMGYSENPRYHPPLWSTGKEAIAPSGAAFYTGTKLPQYHGNLFFASEKDGKLRRAVFADSDKITDVETVPEAGNHARLDVVMGPDGDLYFSSTDTIYRLTAK